MRGLPKTIILLSLVTAAVTHGQIVAKAPPNAENATKTNCRNTDSPDGQDKKGGELRMSVRVSGLESTDSLRLHVTFENVSDKDTILNLGIMLANGRVQMPDAVHLVLTDPGGQSRELHFSDKRYPGIVGRVDDYIVPLRAGSAYTLKLSLKDYWCPKYKEFSLELKRGKYSIRAEFTGAGAQQLNGDTEGLKFMPFWTGKLKSDVAQFQIGNQG